MVTKESFIKFRILAFCMKALSLIFSLLSAISPTHSNSLDNRIQTAIYEPVKAQIVARESRELYATEKNRDLIYGLQGIEMYPLVQIRNTETNDTFYASTTDKITLNNVPIDVASLDTIFPEYQTIWSQVESTEPSYKNIDYSSGFAPMEYTKIPFAVGRFTRPLIKSSLYNFLPDEFTMWTSGDTIFYSELSPEDSLIREYIKNKYAGLGTMHFSLDFIVDGDTISSSGAESTNKFGIKDDVFRVSVRPEYNSVSSWFLSFMNLPFNYGSRGLNDQGPAFTHQTEHRICADCADLVVFAYRKYFETAEIEKDLPYTAATMMISYGEINYLADSMTIRDDGVISYNGEPIPFVSSKGEKGVMSGDVILWGYSTETKMCPHTGIILEDAPTIKYKTVYEDKFSIPNLFNYLTNPIHYPSVGEYKLVPILGEPNGILDMNDLCSHTCFDVTKIEPIKDLTVDFSIMRF